MIRGKVVVGHSLWLDLSGISCLFPRKNVSDAQSVLSQYSASRIRPSTRATSGCTSPSATRCSRRSSSAWPRSHGALCGGASKTLACNVRCVSFLVAARLILYLRPVSNPHSLRTPGLRLTSIARMRLSGRAPSRAGTGPPTSRPARSRAAICDTAPIARLSMC